MSNYAPLHCIGNKQRRKIEARLRRHAELMAQLESRGMPRKEASSQAMADLKIEEANGRH